MNRFYIDEKMNLLWAGTYEFPLMWADIKYSYTVKLHSLKHRSLKYLPSLEYSVQSRKIHFIIYILFDLGRLEHQPLKLSNTIFNPSSRNTANLWWA